MLVKKFLKGGGYLKFLSPSERGFCFLKFKKELCLCCKHLILTLYYTVCYLKIYQINKNKSGKNIPTWI